MIAAIDRAYASAPAPTRTDCVVENYMPVLRTSAPAELGCAASAVRDVIEDIAADIASTADIAFATGHQRVHHRPTSRRGHLVRSRSPQLKETGHIARRRSPQPRASGRGPLDKSTPATAPQQEAIRSHAKEEAEEAVGEVATGRGDLAYSIPRWGDAATSRGFNNATRLYVQRQETMVGMTGMMIHPAMVTLMESLLVHVGADRAAKRRGICSTTLTSALPSRSASEHSKISRTSSETNGYMPVDGPSGRYAERTMTSSRSTS